MGKLTNEELCNQIKVHDCLETYTNNTYLDGESTDIMERYKELKNSTLIDPCTGNDIDLDQTLLDACVRGDNPENALDGVDKIIPDPSFENCKNLKCVYDYLNDNHFYSFCNNILSFETSGHIDLTIKVGTTDWNSEGQVTMGPAGTGAVMTFAQYNCDETDYIRLAETILHESFHARFRYDLANNNMTEIQYKNAFMQWVNQKYGKNFTEHQLMIQFYIHEIASQLAILDGNKYDASYYMAWVWDSLSSQWSGQFSSSQITQWENKRNIVNANNPFKCN